MHLSGMLRLQKAEGIGRVGGLNGVLSAHPNRQISGIFDCSQLIHIASNVHHNIEYIAPNRVARVARPSGSRTRKNSPKRHWLNVMLRQLVHPVLRRLALCLLLAAAPVVDVLACCCQLSAQNTVVAENAHEPVAASVCCSSNNKRPKSAAGSCCAPRPKPQPLDGCCRVTLDTCECCALATPFRPGSRIALESQQSLYSALLPPVSESARPQLTFGLTASQAAATLFHGNRKQSLLCIWRN